MQHPPQHSSLASQNAPSSEHSQFALHVLSPQHVVPAGQVETATQVPFAHVPTWQSAGLVSPEQSTGVWTQPVCALQVSMVQGSPSSQSMVV
jgi:hypothetical protein